jgi:hypothetical protein
MSGERNMTDTTTCPAVGTHVRALLRAVAWFFVACGMVMPAMTNIRAQDLGAMPPLDWTSERQAPEQTEFAAACLKSLESFPMAKAWKLKRQIVTESQRWGLIWRADFEIEGEDVKPLVNRVLCWRKADGSLTVAFAVGQSAKPL